MKKKRVFKKRLKYMRTWVNAWDVAVFWDRVNDLILQAYLQKNGPSRSLIAC